MGNLFTPGLFPFRPQVLPSFNGLQGQLLAGPAGARSAPVAHPGASPPRAAGGTAKTGAAGNCLDGPPISPNISQQLQDQFDAMVYIERVERLRISAQYQQGTGGGASDGAEGSQDASAQLTFAFFGEVRTQELAQFQQRTSAVADGLEGTQREMFIEASQQVQLRFEFSATFSGAALEGFAGSAEKVQGDENAFDRFLALVNKLKDMQDDLTEHVLDLLGGLFKGDGDIQKLFDALLREFERMFRGLAGGNGAGGDSGQVTTVSASVQLEFEFSFSGTVQFSQQGVQQSDPVMLDLDEDGLELTHYSKGARFDILGSGQQVNVAFVSGGDAFLAIDRNGNGRIDSGRELFGDQNGAANGFEELRKLDSNGDALIDARDAGFDALLLFRDNGNGRTEAGELISLADAGIKELRLDYADVNESIAGANRLAQSAWYRRIDGTKGRMGDAVVNYIV